jgi:hypothetical protein
VELVRRYSNRADLQERLSKASLKAVGRGDPLPEFGVESVSGRESGIWRLRDRLSEEDVQIVIREFRAGAAQRVLAAQYGLSLTTVKDLLRQRGVKRAG